MSGFTNTLLDNESSLVTTFHTPLGCYRWLRLPYGVSSGPKEYQGRQEEALGRLKGVCNIADDILIYGCGETHEQAEKDHVENLYDFLVLMREVKMNPAKWVFKTKKRDVHGVPAQPRRSQPITFHGRSNHRNAQTLRPTIFLALLG